MFKSLLAGASALLVATTTHAETFAIQAGHLIADAAQPERGPSTIIVENGRIVRIENGFVAPGGAAVVDERARTVMPGMIDAHVHLTIDATLPWYQTLTTKYSESYSVAMGLNAALRMARAGFTTVRDLNSMPQAGFAVRDAIADGLFDGPRILASGPAFSIVGGHNDYTVGLVPEFANAIFTGYPQYWVCTGAERCADGVRHAAAAGADVIKIMATGGVTDNGAIGLEQHFSNEELKAIIDTAHSLHLKVAAHAHGTQGIYNAARLGVDSVEHGTFIDAAGVQMMKANGTYYVATLMASAAEEQYLGKGIYAPNTEVKARQSLAVWGKGLNMAYRAGVKIAFGTDAAMFPHEQAGRELALMVTKGGMTPRDALIAATRGSADLLGLAKETGTLDPGKSADLIAVEGDPLVDPTAVQRVDYVMVRGRPIPMKGDE